MAVYRRDRPVARVLWMEEVLHVRRFRRDTMHAVVRSAPILTPRHLGELACCLGLCRRLQTATSPFSVVVRHH